MKFLLFIVVSCCVLCAKTQSISKFYNADWEETAVEKALYQAEFTKVPEGYKCVSYWMKTKKIRGESVYPDTLMKMPIGLQKLYTKNGVLEDSVFYEADGQIKEAFHFYPSKKLECHYTPSKAGGTIEAFDEEGKKVKNYVYAKQPEPRGGTKAWNSFLLKAAPKDLSTLPDNPQKVDVHIRFIVDELGNVTKPKVIKTSGMKHVDTEALNMILSSPIWEPAMYKNKPVKSMMTQPLTFELLPAKKS